MPKPIRILRIITRLNVGGPSRHVVQLANGLDPDRFEQILVTGSLSEGEEELADAAKLETRVCPDLARSVAPLKDRRAFLALRAIVDEVKPDIVHTHQAKAGLLGRLAARRVGGPRLVHTFHGHTFEGYWNPVFGRLVKGMERRLSAQTDVLIAQSASQRRDIEEHLGRVVARRMRVISPGVDFESLGSKDRETRSRQFCFVGRLATVKAPERFIETLAAIGRLRGEAPRAFIAGGGAPESVEALKAQAREAGVADDLEFGGYQSDISAVLDDSQVVIMTSHSEGTPLSALESLWCGCRFAAFDVGGIRDITEGLSGVRLAKHGDVDALARGALELLRLGARTPSEQKGLREELKRRFGRERLLENMSGLYEELGAAGPR